MKITHINSPKAGITEHLRPDVARVLIASGLATEVPFPERGKPGWLEAMRERDLNRAPGPHDTPVANVFPPQWSVEKDFTAPIITYRSGCEVWHYRTPPEACPPAIKRQFEEATGAGSTNLTKSQLEQETYKQESASKHGQSRILTMLGVVPRE